MSDEYLRLAKQDAQAWRLVAQGKENAYVDIERDNAELRRKLEELQEAHAWDSSPAMY